MKKKRHITRIYFKLKAIILIFFCGLVFTCNAPAFFYKQEYPNDIRIDNTTIVHSTQYDNLFHFYDNFSYSYNENYLIKKVNGFVHSATISIDLPIKILAQDPVSTEDSIDRILLANLKIKNLMAEYTQLQNRVRQTLDHSYDPLGGKDSSHTPVLKKMDGLETIGTEKEMIFKQINNISVVNSFFQEDGSFKKFDMETSPLWDQKRKEFSENITFDSGSDNAIKTGFTVNSKQLVSMREQVFNNHEKIEVPWVFVFFMTVFKYILNNRTEVFLYIVFLSIIGYFIRLQVRQ